MPDFPIPPDDVDAPAPPPGCVPLSALEAGEEGVVVGFLGGSSFMLGLVEKGVKRNAKVRVLVSLDGGVLVLAGKSKVAIGVAAARRILVRK